MNRIEQFISVANNLGEKRTPFLFIVDFEMEKPLIFPLNQIDNSKIGYWFNGVTNIETTLPSVSDVWMKKYPIAFDTYKTAYDKVMKNILYGNSFLVNLTFATPIETNCTLLQIFHHATAPFKLYLENQFVLFSPEPFVTIRNNKISSYPMKGTISADNPQNAAILKSDYKEQAEHHTMVDLIRNDLSRVATDVKVVDFCYISEVKTQSGNLFQMSSHIEGTLQNHWHSQIGTIMRDLLPAGSVSGAPKDKTLEIITEAEADKRGYYTGICGIYDGETLQSAVMIRYIEQQGEQLVFRSGGGITSMSDAKKEYDEMVAKVYLPIFG